jgi:hypothetical protein
MRLSRTTAIAAIYAIGLALPALALAAPAERTTTGIEVPADIPPQNRELYVRLITFLNEQYLGSGVANHQNGPEIYTSRVDYYGRKNTPVATVMADKAAHYRRWPFRRYEVIPNTFKAREGAGQSVDVEFQYRYEVSDGRRTATGIGTSTIGLISRDGNFIIVKEAGGVVRKGG